MAKHSRAIYFFAVLIVVVSNVVFGLDWQMPKTEVVAYAPPLVAPAKTDGSNTAATDKAALAKQDAPYAALSSNPAVTPNNATTKKTSAPVAQILSQPRCDVSACNSAYRSFRESDCTYQPSNGPRRLCTKGVVASGRSGGPEAGATLNRGADVNPQSNARCNANACAAAYRSFNPSDCTYQPSDGPRRLCVK